MRLNRRRLIATALAGIATPAWAQNWPDRPIRFVVPFGPGGANDLIARAAADGVSRVLGRPIVVENKPGAGAVIGTDHVAKSRPDGSTFLIGAAGVATNGFLYRKLPYADSDLVPVGMIAVAPSVIVVNPSVPAGTLAEFIAWARAAGPQGIHWATAGSGSTPHFVAEMLRDATGVSVNIVPYKSGSEAITAVIGNSVQATSEASIVVLPHVRSGRLKAIATTFDHRIGVADQIPTTAEQGQPSIRIGHWAGLMAPRGTPAELIERMNAALQTALASPETRQRLVPNGIEPMPGSVAAFEGFVRNERERLGKLAARAGMQAE